MVVGQEAVGKTSLLKYLDRCNYDEMTDNEGQHNVEEDDFVNLSTNGIKLGNWKPAVESEFEYQTWDFGGQEVFYPTHKFFLTNRCIYIIVFNATDVKIERPRYWLRQIRSMNTANLMQESSDQRRGEGEEDGSNCFHGFSPSSNFRPPILLVGTHADHPQCTPEYAEEIKNKMAHLFPFNQYNILDCMLVSSKTGKNMKSFIEKVNEISDKFFRKNNNVPRLFHLVEQQLHFLKLSNTPFITYPTYLSLVQTQIGVLKKIYHFIDIYQENDVPNYYKISTSQIDTMTTFLHEIGSIFHFRKEKNLKNLIMLNPQWISDIMSSIITFNHTWVKKGILYRADLPQVWKNFPPSFFPQFIDLLISFGVIYPIRSAAKKTFKLQRNNNSPTVGKGRDEEDGSIACSPLDINNYKYLSSDSEEKSPTSSAKSKNYSAEILKYVIPSLLPASPPKGFTSQWNLYQPLIHYQFGRKYVFDFSFEFSYFINRVLHASGMEVTQYWKFGCLITDPSSRLLSQVFVKLIPHSSQGTSSSSEPQEGGNNNVKSNNLFLKTKERFIKFAKRSAVEGDGEGDSGDAEGEREGEGIEDEDREDEGEREHAETYYSSELVIWYRADLSFYLDNHFDISLFRKVIDIIENIMEEKYQGSSLTSLRLIPCNHCLFRHPVPVNIREIKSNTFSSPLNNNEERRVEEEMKNIEFSAPRLIVSSSPSSTSVSPSISPSSGQSISPSSPGQSLAISPVSLSSVSPSMSFNNLGQISRTGERITARSNTIANPSPDINRGGYLIKERDIYFFPLEEVINTITRPSSSTASSPFSLANHNIVLYSLNSNLKEKNEIDLSKITIKCERGAEVELRYLAPDIVFNDIPIVPNDQLDQMKKIGEGGFGVVYYSLLNRTLPVAVKELSNNNVPAGKELNQMDDVDRADLVLKFNEFQKEVIIMKTFNHPNIVKLYGISLVPALRMIMEWCGGGDLMGLIKKNEQNPLEVSWPHRIKIALDIAYGLEYLQSNYPPIVHRDLRSPNIFLLSNYTHPPLLSLEPSPPSSRPSSTESSDRSSSSTEGSRPSSGTSEENKWIFFKRTKNNAVSDEGNIERIEKIKEQVCAKIGDFGLARGLQSGNLSTILPTWRWLAPEVITSEKFDDEAQYEKSTFYDERADIYSLGIVMWELASFSIPFIEFEHLKMREIFKGIVTGTIRPPFPASGVSKCPPEYQDLITRCWDSNPSLRPSPAEIIHSLTSILLSY